ncbi:unnamed protein product (macronuclear) [Paramecium tetraurelia]|uniref:Transmembrane protein n=1 Tax=Paramecium tetraurelia TaxID=5888 RepID=A0E4B2_PARTE|nr:uncharacterized protein GSPATT00023303001 [Paramecium tetraurelia]CAK90129.1 unnamed protein product [Paramecium tetraurelia]|eukprot:XP_001457526.1 hypothetical protein (macronuclear) [Paramecium tetraurelia strain d4-2]
MIIFCLFYLVCNQKTINQPLYLNLGESVEGFVSPLTSSHHVYHFVVPEIINQTNLVVLLKTSDPESDPNLYISKSVKEPISVQDADVQACEAKGMDICIINNEKVKENDLLYISVVSRFPSSYTLRIELDQEQTLTIEKFLTFKMTSEKQSYIIDFEMYDIWDEATEIEIHVQRLNEESSKEPFQVFMNKYENGVPNNDKFDYVGIDTWENKKVIEFTQYTPIEMYKILIQGEQGSVLRVSATRIKILKTIHVYESITQLVKKGEYDFYVSEFNIPDDGSIFSQVIRLIPFKGNAKLYVHYNFQPPLLDNYEWQDHLSTVKCISISKNELLEKNITMNTIYIAVLGQELCTYQLQYTYETEGKLYPEIRYQRYVVLGEVLKLELFDNVNDWHRIFLIFQVLKGDLSIVVTNCTDQSVCPQDELINNPEKFKNMEEYYIRFYSFIPFLEIDITCNQICNYYVLVTVPPNKWSQSCKFDIEYQLLGGFKKLIQNTPHKSTIYKNSLQFYDFFVSEDDQIQRLSFIVSPIQGEVSINLFIYPSQPDKDTAQYESENSSINFGGEFSNQLLPGYYSITIWGKSSAKYIITVWVVKNSEDSQQLGQYPWHYIHLYQGDWHDHLLSNDEFVLFKIDLQGFEQSDKDPFNVILKKHYGQFLIFGFDHPETNESQAIWQGGQIIKILTNDPNYPQILYLKIKLNKAGGVYGSFRIAYNFYNEQVNLLIGEPFFNFLPANNQQSFRLEISDEEPLMISKRSFDNDQSSLQFGLQKEQAVDIIEFENSNILQIKKKTNSNCGEENYYCSGYLLFSLNSKLDQFYSILVSKMDNSQIQLAEDQPISKVLPLGEDYFYLFCSNQEVNILVFSYFSELKIYASITKDLKSSYPNAKSYVKMSKKGKAGYQTSLYFSESEIKEQNCVQRCIIQLTVSLAKIHSDIKYSNYDYTIQYNSNLILLRESEIQEGYLTQNGLKFYKIHVPNNNQNLMILLKPEPNNEADLLVSKSKFPNQEQYDWGSFELFSDVLILEPGNIIHPDLSGDYYVGVLCQSICQFSLQYHLGKVEAYEIFPNQPYKFYVGEEYTVFLRIYNYFSLKPMMIFLQSHSETALFYVDEVDQQTLNLGYVKDVTQFKYNNNQNGYSKKLVTEPLQFNTILLIALKTYTSEIVTVQVSNEQEEMFLDSQMLLQYYLKKNKHITFILSPQANSITLQIYVFTGQIACSYSIDNLNQDNNFHTLTLLEVRSDNQENNFVIKNFYTSQVVIYFEAIFNCHFSIQYFNEKEDATYIDSIYSAFAYLKGQSEKLFYYTNYDYFQHSTQNKTFSITVQIQEDLNSVLSNQKHRSLPIINVYSNNTKAQLQPVQHRIVSNLVYHEYIHSEKQYQIVLHNLAQFPQFYQIQVGNSELRPLIPRIKQLGTNKLHQSSYWAMQQNDAYLFYEMQFCNGIFSVLVGKDLDLLKNGQYDYKIDIKQNKQIFGFFDKIDLVNVIYLKFDFIKSFDKKIVNAQYTIRAYQVEDKSDIPYDQFYPGLSGVLSSKITEEPEENITLHVEFAPLQLVKQSGRETFLVEQIEYFIILNERQGEDNKDFDYCSEPSNEYRIYQNQIDRDTQLNINATLPNFNKQQQRNFVFTILATVSIQLYRDDQSVQLDYYYETSQIKWNSQKQVILNYSSENYQWVGFVIAVIIILIIGLVAFFTMKRKKMIMRIPRPITKRLQEQK